MMTFLNQINRQNQSAQYSRSKIFAGILITVLHLKCILHMHNMHDGELENVLAASDSVTP